MLIMRQAMHDLTGVRLGSRRRRRRRPARPARGGDAGARPVPHRAPAGGDRRRRRAARARGAGAAEILALRDRHTALFRTPIAALGVAQPGIVAAAAITMCTDVALWFRAGRAARRRRRRRHLHPPGRCEASSDERRPPARRPSRAPGVALLTLNRPGEAQRAVGAADGGPDGGARARAAPTARAASCSPARRRRSAPAATSPSCATATPSRTPPTARPTADRAGDRGHGLPAGRGRERRRGRRRVRADVPVRHPDRECRRADRGRRREPRPADHERPLVAPAAARRRRPGAVHPLPGRAGDRRRGARDRARRGRASRRRARRAGARRGRGRSPRCRATASA